MGDEFDNADLFDWVLDGGVFENSEGKPEIKSCLCSHPLIFEEFCGSKLYLVNTSEDEKVAKYYEVRFAKAERFDDFVQSVDRTSWEAFSEEQQDVSEGLIRHWVKLDNDPLMGLLPEYTSEYEGMKLYYAWLEKKKLEAQVQTGQDRIKLKNKI